MTRGVREQLLEHSDQALNDLKRAVENIEFMKTLYAPLHPDHAGVCESLQAAIIQVAVVLVQFQREKM